MKAYEQILTLVAGALKAKSLYPVEHPGFRRAIDNLLAALKPFHQQGKEITIGVAEDTLVCEDFASYNLPASLQEFLEKLQVIEINAIHFQPGLTAEELSDWVEVLDSDDAEKKKGDWVADELVLRGVTHILVALVTPDAGKVYGEALTYVGSLFGELRMGGIPRPDKAKGIVGAMNRCLNKNPSALIGLSMIKSYDNYLFNHSVNVAILSLALANALDLKDPILSAVGLGGLLHDLGKIRLPREVLMKPGRLSPAEWEVMKQHSTFSFEIIQEMNSLQETTARCALEHHVQYDLKGYPNLGPGNRPNPFSHVVAIADCYDAITTLRVYQNQHGPREALLIMDKLAGTKLDPHYFERFVTMLGMYPIGSVLRLETNELAIVTGSNPEPGAPPKVKIITNGYGDRLEHPVEINLAGAQPASAPSRRVIGTVDPLLRNIDVAGYLK